jgi:hypothetical protein
MSTTIEPDEPTRERPSGPIPTSSADLESGSHPAQGLADIFRQVSFPTPLQSCVSSSSATVRTSRCAPRLVPLSHSRHRNIHPLRLLHRQLCRLCLSSTSWLSNAPFDSLCSQTVIVVVLLAMDFWNCRVRSFYVLKLCAIPYCIRVRTLQGELSLVCVSGIRSVRYSSTLQCMNANGGK